MFPARVSSNNTSTLPVSVDTPSPSHSATSTAVNGAVASKDPASQHSKQELAAKFDQAFKDSKNDTGFEGHLHTAALIRFGLKKNNLAAETENQIMDIANKDMAFIQSVQKAKDDFSLTRQDTRANVLIRSYLMERHLPEYARNQIMDYVYVNEYNMIAILEDSIQRFSELTNDEQFNLYMMLDMAGSNLLSQLTPEARAMLTDIMATPSSPLPTETPQERAAIDDLLYAEQQLPLPEPVLPYRYGGSSS